MNIRSDVFKLRNMVFKVLLTNFVEEDCNHFGDLYQNGCTYKIYQLVKESKETWKIHLRCTILSFLAKQLKYCYLLAANWIKRLHGLFYFNRAIILVFVISIISVTNSIRTAHNTSFK